MEGCNRRSSASSSNKDTVLALLLLLVLQGFGLVGSAANPSPLAASNWGNPRRFVHLQTSTELSTFYLEVTLNGHVRTTTARSEYSVVLLKSESRDRLAILGIKSNRYVCMDGQGTPFTSAVCLRDDCLFTHKLLENHRDVYVSSRTGLLLNLEGSKQLFTAGQNLPQTALFLSQKNTVPLERLLHREKRNRGLAPPPPSDRGEEGCDSRAAPEDDPDPDTEPGEGGHVSREAASNHDPWNVVYASNPASPRITGMMG